VSLDRIKVFLSDLNLSDTGPAVLLDGKAIAGEYKAISMFAETLEKQKNVFVAPKTPAEAAALSDRQRYFRLYLDCLVSTYPMLRSLQAGTLLGHL